MTDTNPVKSEFAGKSQRS